MIVFLAICVATGVLFCRAPKGFLPSEDSGQLFIFTEGPQDVSFDGMVRAAAAGRRDRRARTRTSRRSMSFVGASGINPRMNVGRITIALKPSRPAQAGRRSGARAAAEARQRARHQDLHAERADDPHRRPAHQEPVPVRDAGRRTPSELYQWAPRIEQKLRALPGSSTSPATCRSRGPQVNVEIDREKASALGVSRAADRDRARQRLRRAPGIDHLHRDQPVLGDPGAGAALPARPVGAVAALRALLDRRAGAAQRGRQAQLQRRARSRSPTSGSCPR